MRGFETDPRGKAICRTRNPWKPAVSDDIEPVEVAMVVACDALNVYDMTKILARLAAGI